jgi:hypothetical protein
MGEWTGRDRVASIFGRFRLLAEKAGDHLAEEDPHGEQGRDRIAGQADDRGVADHRQDHRFAGFDGHPVDNDLADLRQHPGAVIAGAGGGPGVEDHDVIACCRGKQGLFQSSGSSPTGRPRLAMAPHSLR